MEAALPLRPEGRSPRARDVMEEVADPHAVLGTRDGRIRLYRPDWKEVFLEVRGERVQAEHVGEGVFEYAADVGPLDYRIFHASGLLAHDPYAFAPTIDDATLAHFNRGELLHAYEVMGGRVCEHQGVKGVKFAVWAPCAEGVSLVADHNHWDGRIAPMRRIGSSGVWELFVPGLELGEKYKYHIKGHGGGIRLKADPYALQGEMRPKTASVIASADRFAWTDDAWIEKRKNAKLDRPIQIYEVHLGSWRLQGNDFVNYRDIAPKLVEYCKEMGYTHIELLPIMGHPLDESWGYQVSGFYAISRRYGLLEDFQFFVNYCHENDIGVILDWVPGHFPTDEHSIAQFDGTYLYEHQDPRQGYHPHWNTHIFNYARYEVQTFLIGSALFYIEKMHVDGFRVDAVTSMLYLNYGRGEGEWIPNREGGHENLEAIAFLQRLNAIVHEKYPGALMIAEEASNFPGITGKIGFDMSWSLGWMNDTLHFFASSFAHRRDAFPGLIHTFSYSFSEKFLLPLSHDEVVHGKKSLLDKMPGNEWEKFAGLRLLLTYMACHPGKTLLFMGGEFGQWSEWNCKEEVHWPLLALPYHNGLRECVRAINHLALDHPALYHDDFSQGGFASFSDTYPILGYFRKAPTEQLLCLHNMSNEWVENYTFPQGNILFSSDDTRFGGAGRSQGVPPLTTLIIEVHP